jgi:hypothetical protein
MTPRGPIDLELTDALTAGGVAHLKMTVRR